MHTQATSPVDYNQRVDHHMKDYVDLLRQQEVRRAEQRIHLSKADVASKDLDIIDAKLTKLRGIIKQAL